MTQNAKANKSSGIIGMFIGLTVLFFVLLVALFLLKIVVGAFFLFAPVVGLITAAYGGYRYWQADAEADKLKAMTIVAAGMGIAFLGVIF